MMGRVWGAIKDPGKAIEDAKQDAVNSATEAGSAWIDGVIDRASERFMDWFTQAIDNLALGGMMVGCFLYMLGIKKGGQTSWVIMAVWFTIKVLLWSGGIPSP